MHTRLLVVLAAVAATGILLLGAWALTGGSVQPPPAPPSPASAPDDADPVTTQQSVPAERGAAAADPVDGQAEPEAPGAAPPARELGDAAHGPPGEDAREDARRRAAAARRVAESRRAEQLRQAAAAKQREAARQAEADRQAAARPQSGGDDDDGPDYDGD